MYFVYITKAEYLHSASDKIKPTLCLVLTYNMNFQTLCAERLRELCGDAAVKYRITHPKHVHMVGFASLIAVNAFLFPAHT